jgi:hypothetical protein
MWQAGHMVPRPTRRHFVTISMAFASFLPTSGTALAAELAMIPAIPSNAPPRPSSAVLYALKLRLPEGQGLARMLMQAGVSQADAAAAARLAAGHLGNGAGGCDAKVEISGALGGGGYSLQRAVLLTSTGETIIERRAGELTVASQKTTTSTARLV